MRTKHSVQPQTLTVAGIPAEVHRKNIRHVYIRVKPQAGHIAVSAPWTVTDAEIERFVQSKARWIRRQLSKPIPPASHSERAFLSGDTLSLWGRSYRLELRVGARRALALTSNTVILTVRGGDTPEKREAFVREWCRERLKSEIARLLEKWEGVTNLKAADFKTKDMKTRWGTCNTKTKTLWFSLQLCKKDPACLDYVVLHELLHLAERGHNQRFYALLSRYLPGWKQVKAALNGRQNQRSASPTDRDDIL